MLLGEIKKTDKGWLTYIAERAKMRDRLTELEAALNSLNLREVRPDVSDKLTNKETDI